MSDDEEGFDGDVSVHSSDSGNEPIAFSESGIESSTRSHRGHNRSVNTGNYSSQSNVRKGKWTIEEENYTNKIISMFNRGKLPIPAGTTLRSYLSEKLNCDPMRITKKFAGATSIGKVVYQPADSFSDSSRRQEDNTELDELKRLEVLFLEKLNGRDGDTQGARSQTSATRSGGRDNREATSPATAKITEVVEKIRAHDRGLRSNDRSRVAAAKNDELSTIRSRSAGLKRIVSAPNFSLLSSLQTPWKNRESLLKPESESIETSRDSGNSAPVRTVNKKYGNMPAPIPNQTHAHLSSAIKNQIREKIEPPPYLRSRKRSQSVMDFQEYEHLTSFMVNDQAASDLLLQFSQSLRDSSPNDPEMTTVESVQEPSPAICAIPYPPTIGSQGIAFLRRPEEPTISVFPNLFGYSNIPHVDIGLSIDEDHFINHIPLGGSAYELVQKTNSMKLSEADDVNYHLMKRSRSNELLPANLTKNASG